MKLVITLIASIYAARASAFMIAPVINTNLSSKTNTMSLKMGFFDQFFPNKDEVEIEEPYIPDVVVDPNSNLSILFGAIGIFVLATSPGSGCVEGSLICPPSTLGVIQGGLNIVFAAFLAIQARRIRFVFDSTSFELKNTDSDSSGSDDTLQETGENFVVGGANRWDYDKFVNWDFFPNEQFPILVYFKENQTPEEKWSEGPGSLDKIGGGQLHFFPAIANVQQLKEQFEIRGCAKIEKSAEIQSE
mmetsp:Transcript_33985/g.40689  ORF Transcript_33985/g.40689 Transcript_33985/m.40689 type:complete len:246 (-) Transcript_33985:215-952(-)|eukprot:CAMPEP_0198270034 /NCGR_PEP_ID=MMETSP1447-20131203/43543_1 /TAXON_ID=420782 /ORGANISM="Chaetoceros dichaeta, Strain CCMP1751" /LENGTH=245 /DNA_ID=CAMNT_0043961891 /DNA_START=48 /DNA_END=785 /DNA_ORIENTATION=+